MRRLLIIVIILHATAMPLGAQAQPPGSQTVSTAPTWAQIAFSLIPAISACLAAIGLLLNFYQARRNNAQARATLVAECLKGFTADEDIQRAFYEIEYSEFKHTEDFHGSKSERDIDKLLRHFSNTALAWQAGLLSTRDLEPIKYYLVRIVRDPEIQKYLDVVRSWSKQQGIEEHPYAVLRRLAERLIQTA